jgi:Uncharacterized protein conserved in bacteria (DUF2059)
VVELGTLLRLLIAIVGAVVVYVPVGAASEAASVGASSVTAAAFELAKVTNSAAVIIGDASDDERSLALVPQLLDATPELTEIEAKYPGFLVEFARELAPITNRSWRERLPILWKRQADLYAATFKATELEALRIFYTSATGQKLISGMKRALKPTAMLAEAKGSADLHIGSASALADIKATVPDVARQMDTADQAVLIEFANSGLAPRLQKLAPLTQTIALEWMSESAPWEDAETQALFQKIVTRRESSGSKK